MINEPTHSRYGPPPRGTTKATTSLLEPVHCFRCRSRQPRLLGWQKNKTDRHAPSMSS